MDSATPASEQHPHPKGLGARLRAYFFAGILFTAPVGITFYVAWAFVGFIDGKVAAILPDRYNPLVHLPYEIPGVGLLVLIVALTIIGAFAAGFFGRFVTRVSDDLLARMPVIRGLYSAIKQLFETVLSKKSSAFREVVLVEYPRRDIWTIAFVTGSPTPDIAKAVKDENMISIYVPTTPNPTSGFLLFVPRTDLIYLEMSVEDGLKYVISTGIVAPSG
jgi:uncharacterized membrane protein